MALFGKSESSDKTCSCCGKKLNIGALAMAGDLVKLAAKGKNVNLGELKTEDWLDPRGKGLAKMLFDDIQREGYVPSKAGTYHLKVGERTLCDDCCTSIVYSMTDKEIGVYELATFPKARFDAIYDKIDSLPISELKERSGILAEKRKKAKADSEIEDADWINSLK